MARTGSVIIRGAAFQGRQTPWYAAIATAPTTIWHNALLYIGKPRMRIDVVKECRADHYGGDGPSFAAALATGEQGDLAYNG